MRTILGDIEPSSLGITYAHEHLVIDGGGAVTMSPDFLLVDADRLTEELQAGAQAGLRTVVDAMPADCGRNPLLLAELSRRSGVQIIGSTGLHHEKFYGPWHWSRRATDEEIAALFVADIVDGIDARDYGGPIVERTAIRAGLIKIAGSASGPSERDLPIFRAAALAHHQIGVPVHTHCEGGTGAVEQIALLTGNGMPSDRISLSHVDKVVDRGYQRAIFETGAFVVYDQAFRWGDRDNGTLTLLEWAAEDGHLDQVMLGMDAARQGYYAAYGGRPGLPYLLVEFSRLMNERGLDAATRDRFFRDNPARAFAFAEVSA
ncbi:MAG: aryldialkylphosphatase [Chloroflexota bacterium]